MVGVTAFGFYMWRKRKSSASTLGHAMVAEVIRQVHDDSHQTYGARRVHAELTIERNMAVARCTVELVMHRLDLARLPGRPKYPKTTNSPTAETLDDRDVARTEPNRLKSRPGQLHGRTRHVEAPLEGDAYTHRSRPLMGTKLASADRNSIIDPRGSIGSRLTDQGSTRPGSATTRKSS